MLKNKKLSIDESGSLMMQLAETMEPLCEPPPPPIPARDEYFNDGYHSDITVRPGICLNTALVTLSYL